MSQPVQPFAWRTGKTNFKELEKYMLEKGDVTPNTSGRQEMLENILNEFI